jgi:hypothetical protein
MGTSILALLSNLASIAAGWMGIQSKKLDLHNAPDMKAAAVAQDEAKAVDLTSQAIAQQDTSEIRKELAE